MQKLVIDNIKYNEKIFGKSAPTTITETGDLISLKVMSYQNRKLHIKRINSDEYVVLSTGEIKRFKHQTGRVDNTATLSKTFLHIRDLINTNVSSANIQNVRWVTLTYAENMTDTERLYTDFKKFIQRLRYWCDKNSLGNFEYIGVTEPQSRGAWHWHLLLIWKETAPYIENSVLRDIWGFGFIKITALNDNIDNVGLYLSAYLCDLELEETTEADTSKGNVKITSKNGKRYVKGARLKLYPAGLHIYRISRGIKQPKVIKTTQHDAQKYVASKNAELRFEKNYFLGIGNFGSCISKRTYSAHPQAQERVLLRKAYNAGRFYRTLLHEPDYAELDDTICYRPCDFDDIHEEYLRDNPIPELPLDLWDDIEEDDVYDCY